jgi:uncharacterized protein
MSTNPWLVPITTLKRQPGSRRVERRAGRLGAELRVADSRVAEGAEVEADATIDSVDGGIEVAAVVRAPWVGECRRCLRPVGGDLRCEVREMYRPRPPGEAPDEDEETYPLTGEMLDLRPLVRDAVLLDLPIAPLCRPDCAGLCPSCGADLNEGPCACPPPVTDPRWGALDVLRGEGGGAEEAAGRGAGAEPPPTA